ncbi:MAG: DEAD/DEAH box helicase [Sphingobacteriia bacterium]|nr:DEAD/DEAH box helicase [Sphingobacteriia bacterium]
MNNFQEMGLPKLLSQSLERLKFATPTPIQAQTIPLALQGRDVLGSAQTGTGKTLAFSIPLISKLIENPESSALILMPTREIAQQVEKAIKQLISNQPKTRVALLIGGESIVKQLQILKSRPRIIVGTPGRVIDHIQRKTFPCSNIDFLVLDEMDRMFDMGFSIQIEEIIKNLPKKRQTLMFSATLPTNVASLAQKYLNQPERISIGSVIAPAAKIKQDVIQVSEEKKYDKFLHEINEREGSIIVFVATKIGADRLAEKLQSLNHKAMALHGDLRQNKRERIINSFRHNRFNVLVATDVAARGLDISHIKHVINYDLPNSPEDYIHRIGRTARAGAEGFALCLVSPKDSKKWRVICNFMDPDSKTSNVKPEVRSGHGGGNSSRRNNKRNDRFSKNPNAPKRDGYKKGGFKSEDGFKKSDGSRNDSFKNDGFKGDGFKKTDGGFKKSDGFKKTGGFKKADGGFKKSDGGFKKSDGGFKKSEGFKKPGGFKKGPQRKTLKLTKKAN